MKEIDFIKSILNEDDFDKFLEKEYNSLKKQVADIRKQIVPIGLKNKIILDLNDEDFKWLKKHKRDYVFKVCEKAYNNMIVLEKFMCLSDVDTDGIIGYFWNTISMSEYKIHQSYGLLEFLYKSDYSENNEIQEYIYDLCSEVASSCIVSANMIIDFLSDSVDKKENVSNVKGYMC